ncbi:alpha/beta hydrolase [uncultured Tateyamaria sp.]|uniref:alpha/beta fold hydrolase n=1 Tax=uncultured Tateyamaria sp. TaxID=455651 RepID=UPI00260E7B9E|nr:alpha/beta hydrolase [uncultured Tateyamaria sp.]
MIPHIHRRSFGSGPRPLLAIHCSLAHAGAWRGMGAALGDIATLHAYDLPNHGKSGDWDGQGVMHDAATDMALAVLDDIGPVDVIGHSFGATVALRLAIEHPKRIRSAILFEPVYFAPLMADDPGFVGRYGRDTAAYDQALEAGDNVGAARAFNSTWGDTAAWDTLPDASRTYMAERIHFVRDSAPFLQHDSANLLAPGRFEQATGPVLLMRGETSPWAKDVNGAIARRLPNVQEVALPDVGHMAPITHPDRVAAHVRSFWSAQG